MADDEETSSDDPCIIKYRLEEQISTTEYYNEKIKVQGKNSEDAFDTYKKVREYNEKKKKRDD